MSVIKITTENFNKEVIDTQKTVLLDFYADWCGPCRMVAPIVEEIASEHPEYTIGKINVDEQGVIAEKFGILSIPALFVIKDGKIKTSAVGFKQKQEILNMLKD